MKGHVYFLLAILLLGIASIYLALQISAFIPTYQFKAQLLPVVFGIVLVILSVVGLVVELKKKAAKETKAPKEVTTIIIAAAWLIGFVVLIFLIGFVLAALLFGGAYFKLHNRGWIGSIAFGLVMGIFTYVVFDLLLGVDLYQGVIYIPFYRFLP
ncbi:tripartite tricarboxylate transporter TctB family protein [Chloroflexota bacterium]